MDKTRFLEILGQKLSEELPRDRVISNLQYYEKYIDDAVKTGKSEQEVLDELGDPYMIAHTIWDTETGEAFYEQQFAEDAVYTETETTYPKKDENGTAKQDGLDENEKSEEPVFEKTKTYSEQEYQQSVDYEETPENDYQTGYVHYIRTNHGCLIMAIALILIVVVVVTLVGKVINFLWPVLAPILLILLVVSIFSDRRR